MKAIVYCRGSLSLSLSALHLFAVAVTASFWKMVMRKADQGRGGGSLQRQTQRHPETRSTATNRAGLETRSGTCIGPMRSE